MDCVLACYSVGPGSVPAKSKCSNEWLKTVWLWKVVIRSPVIFVDGYLVLDGSDRAYEASVHYHLPSAHSIKLSNIKIIFLGNAGKQRRGCSLCLCHWRNIHFFYRKSSFKSRLVSFRLCNNFFSLTWASNLIRQQQQKRKETQSASTTKGRLCLLLSDFYSCSTSSNSLYYY